MVAFERLRVLQQRGLEVTAMFHRFIAAMDLSPATFDIVRRLGGLKALGCRECLLLHCMSFTNVMLVAWTSGMEILRPRLAEQRRILEHEGFVTSARFIPGLPKMHMKGIAKNYSLVVVGSRVHSMLGEAMLEGVAYAVIHRANKPVLIVRVQKGTKRGKRCIQGDVCDFSKHILFPTDFSESAYHAFIYLKGIVSCGAGWVTLFHVQDKSSIDSHISHRLEEFDQIDRGRLEQMKTELEKRGNAQVETELAYGSPVQEILRVIREKDVQVVVMGSHGRGWIKEISSGSVSHSIARLSPASVLLIPAAA